MFQRLSEKKGATTANQQFTASQEGDRSRHRYVLRTPGFDNVYAIISGKVQILQCIAVLEVTMEGWGVLVLCTQGLRGVRLLMAGMKHDKRSQIMCVT